MKTEFPDSLNQAPQKVVNDIMEQNATKWRTTESELLEICFIKVD